MPRKPSPVTHWYFTLVKKENKVWKFKGFIKKKTKKEAEKFAKTLGYTVFGKKIPHNPTWVMKHRG